MTKVMHGFFYLFIYLLLPYMFRARALTPYPADLATAEVVRLSLKMGE
jgi:hypothetical protein